MYGVFADVAEIRALGVPVIEDCAQAVDYAAKHTICGDIAVFSFHPTKCMTTGEGGMGVSRSAELVKRMRSIRDGCNDASSGRLFSPLSDTAAALGLSQLARYHEALDRRKTIADIYTAALSDIMSGAFLKRAMNNSMHFRYPLVIHGGCARFQNLFLEKKVHVRRGVDKLLHRYRGLPDTLFPNSTLLFNSTVSLPIYPALKDDEAHYCAGVAHEVFSDVSKS
jgi:UDP-4-amino-4-deoxy-L-arabinose-oxoglutarate aminotransferase